MAESLEVGVVEAGTTDAQGLDVVDLGAWRDIASLVAMPTQGLDEEVIVADALPGVVIATGASRATSLVVYVTISPPWVRALQTARAIESKAAAVAGAGGCGRHAL
jgi:hypothetical protein